MITRVFSALLIVALAAGSSDAQTATSSAGWPSKPIKLIVPFPPGSSTDVIARIVAQMLSPLLEQSFVIENRVGASGMIGAEATRSGLRPRALMHWHQVSVPICVTIHSAILRRYP